MNVTGQNGVTIDEAWQEKIYSYGGIALPGFPNLFMLYGPFSPANSREIRRPAPRDRRQPAGVRSFMLCSCRSEGVQRMTEAKLAPNLPEWMVEHANRYLSSGGTDGHIYKMTQPGRPEITVPSLLLTTTGRKSGKKYIFPLFYGKAGDSYFVVASKGGAPQHPGWYRNILANPDVEVQAGTAKIKARARTATGEERARLWEKSLEFWPPYADYQQKTEREIPVVVLDPVR
jgi:deazaflavin-dependent oxidoreductase (nitroreductase family)